MKYSKTFMLNGTLDEVMDSVKYREFNADPNIRSIKKVCWEETDTEIHCEYHVHGNSDIPDVIRHLISPNMISWREIAHWDKPGNSFKYTVKPFYFPNAFRMNGKFQFKQKVPGCIECHLDGEIRVGIPMFGDFIERTIVKRQLEAVGRQTECFNKRTRFEHRKSG